MEEEEAKVEEPPIIAICNKLGHRSFECPQNEETRHRGAHIAQGKEENSSLYIMDEIPEIRESLVMRKVLLKQVKEANKPPQ